MPGLEPTPLHCNQTKFTTISINNFNNFLAQFNIYFENVWHPQEKNSRSATVYLSFDFLRVLKKVTIEKTNN